MGPTWVLSSPGGTHFGPTNLVIRVRLCLECCQNGLSKHTRHAVINQLRNILEQNVWYIHTLYFIYSRNIFSPQRKEACGRNHSSGLFCQWIEITIRWLCHDIEQMPVAITLEFTRHFTIIFFHRLGLPSYGRDEEIHSLFFNSKSCRIEFYIVRKIHFGLRLWIVLYIIWLATQENIYRNTP